MREKAMYEAEEKDNRGPEAEGNNKWDA